MILDLWVSRVKEDLLENQAVGVHLENVVLLVKRASLDFLDLLDLQ